MSVGNAGGDFLRKTALVLGLGHGVTGRDE